MAKLFYVFRVIWEIFALSIVISVCENISDGALFNNWDELVDNSIIIMIFWVISMATSLLKDMEFHLFTDNIPSLIITIILAIILYKGMPFIVIIAFLINGYILIAYFRDTWDE